MRQLFNFPKKNKYNADKVTHDGIEFDSKVEGQRYLYLKTLQMAGEISGLETHKTYELLPKQTKQEVKHLKTKDKVVERVVFKSVTYTPDFVYMKDGQVIAEDVKPTMLLQSRDFPLRRKMMYYYHNIYVNIVTYTKKRGWEIH